MKTIKTRLTEVIAPAFYVVHHAIKAVKYAYYWLKGGRGSTKSSFVSVEIVKGMMEDPDANAIVLRKVAETLRESVYDQILWAIDKLGVTDKWESSVSSLRVTYKPTGQRISFKGADKPKKVKSSKFRRGYAKFIWFEELDEFKDMDEVRMICQSLVRGGEDIQVFFTYNPPKSATNWVNGEVEQQGLRSDTMIHHSDYTTVPPTWLGEQFILDAEHIKKVQPEKYDHEYMGTVTGTGAEVFKNLTLRRITDDEIKAFDNIGRGLDHGYAGDPLHYTENHFDKTRRRLFIFTEIHQTGLSNEKAVRLIQQINNQNRVIIADREPRTNNEFRLLGLRIIEAKKGPDSREHGTKWLQDLEEIIVDPERCPNTAREFRNYELDRDSNGNFKGKYPDGNDHSIDATRYSREDESTQTRITAGRRL